MRQVLYKSQITKLIKKKEEESEKPNSLDNQETLKQIAGKEFADSIEYLWKLSDFKK
jgi:hypothetical protein